MGAVAVAVAYTLPVQLYAYTPPVHVYYSCSILISSYSGSTCTLTGSPYDLRPKVAIKGRARSAMMAYLGDTTTAHNAAPPPRSTTTTPARVTYPCSHRQCQLGVQGVGRRAEKPIDAPKLPASGVSNVAKSPKKPRRGNGGEHDPAVNTAAGAPLMGVSVDPAVNTTAKAAWKKKMAKEDGQKKKMAKEDGPKKKKMAQHRWRTEEDLLMAKRQMVKDR